MEKFIITLKMIQGIKNNKKPKSCFVISLDLELYWGIRDTDFRENYRKNILGERYVIPILLEIFKKYEIHATWAVVGFLFAKNKNELIEHIPVKKPSYINNKLSPYEHIKYIGNDEDEDPLHYAHSLINLIKKYPNQEIATHTFSHYYCLEKGQDSTTFKEDIEAAKQIANKYNINIESIVFPRNQVNKEYLKICKESGIKIYRGNETAWYYKKNFKKLHYISKLLRFIDSYIMLNSNDCYTYETVLQDNLLINIPSSRFLRPYNHNLIFFEGLRFKRIASRLKYAAKHGLIYHLWWHPHNFGINIDKNLAFLKKIFDYYFILKKKYGMQSLNMKDFVNLITFK